MRNKQVTRTNTRTHTHGGERQVEINSKPKIFIPGDHVCYVLQDSIDRQTDTTRENAVFWDVPP
jgi:hypothetical protein